MATVKFRFEDTSLSDMVVEGIDEGLSILEVTEENDIHLNHNCGGVCACSTCHIYINKGEDFLEEISDKEEDFIDRAINPRLESRLGCQCIILDNNAYIEVTIPDQSQIIGHEH
jgi:2Fe-2S ferredoxin